MKNISASINKTEKQGKKQSEMQGESQGKNQGLFISFEGGDGCGKSTQVLRLCKYLEKHNIDYIQVKEPGDTKIGESIRSLLLDKNNTEMTSLTELMLYEAARAQICSEVISPALKAGKIVVSDRFADSSVAYQGYGRNLGAELVEQLNNIATTCINPDITFFLDMPPELALERAYNNKTKQEPDRLELAGLEFQKAVYDGFICIAKKNSQRVIIIDAKQKMEDVEKDIFKVLQEKAPQYFL